MSDIAAAPPGHRLARRVMWWCLLALVIVVPLAISNFTWIPGVSVSWTLDPFDLVKVFVARVFVIVGLCALAWDVLVEGAKLRRTKADVLVAAVVAWFAVCSAFSISPTTSLIGAYTRWDGMFTLLTYAGAYFLAVQCLDSMGRVTILARAIVVGGAIVAAYGLLQHFGLDPLKWGTVTFESQRAFSTLGNPDMLGGYLLFPLLLSIALALAEDRPPLRLAEWAAFFLTALCLFVTYTRGAWIAALLGLALVSFAAVRARVKLQRVDLIALATTVIAGAGLAVRSLASSSPVLNVGSRLSSLASLSEGSGYTRLLIWRAALSAARHRLITGWGPDTFGLVFPQFRAIEYIRLVGPELTDNAHSYPLQLLVTVGIPGLLLLYGLFVWVAVRSWPVAFCSRATSREPRLVLAGLWAASAAYLAHLTVGLSVPGSTLLLWIAVAALSSSAATTTRVDTRSWGRAGALVVAGVGVVLIAASAAAVAADNVHLRAVLSGPTESRAAAAVWATRLNPLSSTYREQLAIVYTDAFGPLAGQLLEPAGSGVNTPVVRQSAQSYFDEAQRVALAETVRDRYNVANYIALANLDNIAGRALDTRYFAAAEAISRQGLAISPTSPELHYNLAIALAGTNRRPEALREVRVALDEYPGFTDARMFLGDELLASGDAEGALAAYLEAKRLDPAARGIDAAIAAARAATATPAAK